MNRLIGALLSKILAPFVDIGPPKGWLEQIPRDVRPDERKCNELEKLRVRYHIPNDVFTDLLPSSSAITRRVQENVYANAKQQMPNASERELLEAVFRSRVFPQHPYGFKITEEKIQETMENINTLDDLKECVVAMDQKESPFPGRPFGIGKKRNKEITKILEN